MVYETLTRDLLDLTGAVRGKDAGAFALMIDCCSCSCCACIAWC